MAHKVKNKDEQMTAQEFAALLSWLVQQGVGQDVAQEVLGGGVNGRTREQITQELKAWMRTFIKQQTLLQEFLSGGGS